MSGFKVDLTNCDREPIHIPGQIQSHGFLIVIDKEHIVRYYSDNIYQVLPGLSGELLDQPLLSVPSLRASIEQLDFVIKFMETEKNGSLIESTNPAHVIINSKPWYLVISQGEGQYLFEFEPAISEPDLQLQSLMGRSVAEILGYKKINKILEHAAKQVRAIIGYDRVMVYRFEADGHGVVCAEDKKDDLEPWLGLHYPASDIPQQARELYKLNLTRLIADVENISSKISTSPDNFAPLDLTHSQLRAVSPIHIQYLKNMGVASSFSISLVCNNELWGLIACHNYTPRFIDFKSREYAKLIGQILSSSLEFRLAEVDLQVQAQFKKNLDELVKSLHGNASIKDGLIQAPETLLNMVNAHGVALVYEGQITKFGVTPDDEDLTGLTGWLKDNISEKVYHTNNLSAEYPEAAAFKDVGSGVMVCVLSKKLEEYAIWFKPELIHTVNWAGKPDKPTEIGANGLLNISPRNSFETWVQTVVATSEPWSREEIRSVSLLKEEVTYAINIKADAIRILNERLQLAYDELETFSYTISHDLKNPLTAIKAYAQLLTRDKTMAEKGLKMAQNIVDRADQMDHMIKIILELSRIKNASIEYRHVNADVLINDIVKDLAVVHDTADLHITVGKTPALRGDPMMMLQVFSNLIGNAVKYLRSGLPGLIHIEGEIIEDKVHYQITDNGRGIAANDLPRIFDLFNRMDNVKDIEGSGVGLAIVKRIVDKHNGSIWVESELDKGSVFHVAFNK